MVTAAFWVAPAFPIAALVLALAALLARRRALRMGEVYVPVLAGLLALDGGITTGALLCAAVSATDERDARALALAYFAGALAAALIWRRALTPADGAAAGGILAFLLMRKKRRASPAGWGIALALMGADGAALALPILTRWRHGERAFAVGLLLSMAAWLWALANWTHAPPLALLMGTAGGAAALWASERRFGSALADAAALVLLLPLLALSAAIKRRFRELHRLVTALYAAYAAALLALIAAAPLCALMAALTTWAGALVLRKMLRQLRDGWRALWVWGLFVLAAAWAGGGTSSLTYPALLLLASATLWRSPRPGTLALTAGMFAAARLGGGDLPLAALLALWADRAPLPRLKLGAVT